MISALRRHAIAVSLILAFTAVTLSVTGVADAAKAKLVDVVSKPKKNAVLKLGKNAKFPSKAIPTVSRAKAADTVGGKTADELVGKCDSQSVDLGTWCLLAAPYPVPNEDIGKNSFFYATQKCAELGGYLPTAAQLIGAAKEVKLASTLDDDRLTASIDEDATDGRRDRREMSATLVTTQAGSSAAGSQGVSDGSRGDPKQGEPDPAPQPPSPSPESLQYVTVYDNGDKGGFAGSRPVSQPENFRCAFNKAQGQAASEEG
jgi:hypothetical protein